MNFIYSNWDNFCNFLNTDKYISQYKVDNSYLNSKFCIIKHDVECKAKNALDIAHIESKNNIHSVFYVQFSVFADNIDLFKEIKSLGHEIGYHYDVLDENNGNLDAAVSQFKEHINFFSDNGFQIRTICPHGNPLKIRNGWSSNRDFWVPRVRLLFPDIFDIVVELPELHHDYKYISDAGYSFNLIQDITVHRSNKNINVNSTSTLKSIVQDYSVIISTHPHRWHKSSTVFRYNFFKFIFLRKVAPFLYKIPPFKYLINRFYYLAKRF